jgi:hypothetical protein
VRSPASSGPSPWAIWKNWLSRKIEPNVPKNIANETPFVATNARERKKRSGSIGSARRACQSRNAASRSSRRVRLATTVVLDQPERVGAHDAEGQAEQAGAGEREAGEVEPGVRTVGLGQQRCASGRRMSRPAR